MPAPLSLVVRKYLHRFAAAPSSVDLAEPDLLERFIDARDEDAFATLLRRHGPMVLWVARRLLRDQQQAEDVFQATFLVLARKAATIRQRTAVASWLYGVATRLALKARAARQRRQHQEHSAIARHPVPTSELLVGELHSILHEELSRLSAKYRDPLVLCYLDGRTRDEAARLLRLPLGTLKGRLDRGRDLLHRGLIRRGITSFSALGFTALAKDGAQALPPSLVTRTVQMASGPGPTSLGLLSVRFGSLGDKLTAKVLSLAIITALGAAFVGSPKPTGVGADEPCTEAVAEQQPRTPGPFREWDHETRVVEVAFSPDGHRLATAGGLGAGSVRIWDAETGRHLVRFGDHPDGVSAIAFSPDGKLLASSGWGGEVVLWRASDGQRLGQLPAHASVISSLAFTNDGQFLVTATMDGTIRFWDHVKNNTAHQFETPTGSGLLLFALSPDGNVLAGFRRTSPTTDVFVLDLKTMKEKVRIRGVVGLEAINFSPDSCTLAGETKFEGVPLWNARTGKAIRSLGPPAPGPHEVWGSPLKNSVIAPRIAFSPDGRLVAVARSDRAISLYEVRSGQERCRLSGLSGTLSCLAFTANGTGFVAGSSDGKVRAWGLDPFVSVDPPAAPRTAKECERLFDELLAEGKLASRAITALGASPGETVPFLARRLRPVLLEPTRAKQLLINLDDRDFTVRERATAELEQLGPAVQQMIEEALGSKPSLEVRGRLNALLEKLKSDTMGGERLRTLRAIEVLERIGTPEARELLSSLATGTPGMAETEDAKAATERIGDRRSKR